MQNCVICRKDKECFNVEHVIPDAIGGNFKIDTVCCDCNSKLGSRIDPLLTEHVFSLFLRKKHNIKSQNGRIVNCPINNGNSQFTQYDSSDIKLRISKDGKSLEVVPVVKRNEKLIEEATFDEKDPNLTNFIQTHGLRENEFIKAAIDKIDVKTKIDANNFQITLIKIAFEFACEKITSFRNCERAIEISKFLYNSCYSKSKVKSHSFDQFLIKSSILNNILPDLLNSFLIDTDDTHYIIGISIRGLGTVCYIRIFTVFYSIILLTEELLLDEDEYVVIENNLNQDKHQELNFNDLIQRKFS